MNHLAESTTAQVSFLDVTHSSNPVNNISNSTLETSRYTTFNFSVIVAAPQIISESATVKTSRCYTLNLLVTEEDL